MSPFQTGLMEIKAIPAQLTWEVRHKAMWPNKPFSYIKIENDAEGQHFGLYLENKLVSVISIFITDTEAQFRKFATVPQYQGNGYGSSLLSYIFKEMSGFGIKRLWCNARLDKTSFYERFGMLPTQTTFERGNISYVIMESYLQGRKKAVK